MVLEIGEIYEWKARRVRNHFTVGRAASRPVRVAANPTHHVQRPRLRL